MNKEHGNIFLQAGYTAMITVYSKLFGYTAMITVYSNLFVRARIFRYETHRRGTVCPEKKG